ncbi:MAG: hypothetical protein ACTSRZ_17980 [Promethearchaeota archaeon]
MDMEIKHTHYGCGKQLITARQDRDDAIICGDIQYNNLYLCKECEEKFTQG